MGENRQWPRASTLVGALLAAVVAATATMVVTSGAVSGQTAASLAINPTSGLAGTGITLTPSGFPAGIGCNSLSYIWNPRAPITLGSGKSTTAPFKTTVPTTATNGTYPIDATCTDAAGAPITGVTRFTVTGPATTTTSTTTTIQPTTTTTRPVTTTTAAGTPTTTRSSPTTTAKGSSTTVKGSSTTTGVGSTTTSSGSSSSTGVSIDSTPTTVPGQAPVTATTYLRLTALAIAPGASVSANGRGCDAGAPVALTIGSASVGHTRATASGAFHAPLTLGPLSVGRYTVVARCGPILAAPLDIVLASQVSAATSTLAIIIFALLIGALAFRRQIFPRRPRPTTAVRGPDEPAGA